MGKVGQLRIEKRLELKGHKLEVLHDNSEARIPLYAKAEVCHNERVHIVSGRYGTT